jgi:hypothetical protein
MAAPLSLKYTRMNKPQKKRSAGALVAHACHPVYSGGRDQEDYSLKPAQANNPISKIGL